MYYISATERDGLVAHLRARKYTWPKINHSLNRWAAKLGNKELAQQILKNSKCEVNYIDRETGTGALFPIISVIHCISCSHLKRNLSECLWFLKTFSFHNCPMPEVQFRGIGLLSCCFIHSVKQIQNALRILLRT